MSDGMWGGDALDLGAYLARTGYGGADPQPDLATLRELQRAHVDRIPFENLEIMLGRPVLLELDALQAKMVARRRGGYCFEQNLLFAAVLERIGFEFTGLTARVRMGSDQLRAATHMLLSVDLDGERWLADVGFGGEGLQAPIPLKDGAEVRQGGWTFSLAREDGGVWVLRSLHPDGWFSMYAFTEEPHFPPDYAVVNYYISTHPRSPFTTRPVLQKPEPLVRTTLIGTRLSVVRPDGSEQEREVPAEELGMLLEQAFGIELSEGELAELRQRYRTISG
ncbi:arylamine N-acetyltransferase family protein [Streptomyces gobiensis]|uniref:arylamine N-acetyltransferase family protein n=1 Tax=Streptomyces gobiensis TaxID=2875706 RepID=UPI001E4896F7|nr:arylamine N-acetyltransferase [Streptomyces gobiensis]UGY94020.1 arylamine N-acetyltransferase [Streptomyces gobiensis]